MEIFMLMAVGVTVSVALMINKKREPLHFSFAALCLAITFHKGGVFFNEFFPHAAWHLVGQLGLLAIPALTIHFSRDLFPGQTLVRKRDIRTTALLSMGLAILLLTPLRHWEYYGSGLYLYADAVLLLCYLSLIVHARQKAAGAEKKRLVYLIMACTAAIATYTLPPLFNLIIAGMLYFILIMIIHPHLTELHDLMTRALVILIVALFATVLFYLVIGFFGPGPAPPFLLVFMVSFLIMIAVGPFQVVLKRLLTRIDPEIKDVFTSPFDLDEKLEREKALLLEKMAPVFAHEIRNPLGSIKGAAQVLRSEAESEEQKNLLDVITEEVNRLNRVVSQFLDYARPYSPELRPRSDQRRHRKGPGPHRGQQPLGRNRHPVGTPPPSAARPDGPGADPPGHPEHRPQRHRGDAGGRHADGPDLADRKRHRGRRGHLHPGHGGGDAPRDPPADLHPLLHDQGAGRRPGACRLRADHPGPRRQDPGQVDPRQGDDLLSSAWRRCGEGRWHAVRVRGLRRPAGYFSKRKISNAFLTKSPSRTAAIMRWGKK